MARGLSGAVVPLGALLVGGALPQTTWALSACTAQDIVALDPGCPASGPCTVTEIFDVGDGCALDFGMRDVTLAARARLNIGDNAVTIKAGALTLAADSLVDGNKSGADLGGAFFVEVLGDMVLEPTARIDVSGKVQGGTVSVRAGGAVTLAGKLTSDKKTSAGQGGEILVQAIGDIVIPAGATVTAVGGNQAGGGTIDLEAGGRVEVLAALDVSGGEGGLLDVASGGTTLLSTVQASGGGDGGSGGEIDVSAGTGADIVGDLLLKGVAGAGFGGDGGILDVEAQFGDLTVAAAVIGEGAEPDGGGGDVSLAAAGSVFVQPTGKVSAAGNGGQGSGGVITLDSVLDIVIDGRLDASGGLGGGSVQVTAGRDARFNARVDARARKAGGLGGGVFAFAGFEGVGALTVGAEVDTSASGCDSFGFCSGAGEIVLMGCDVTVARGGGAAAGATVGGSISLVAQEQLTVSGPVNAVGSSGSPADQGSVQLTHRSAKPAVVTVAPAPLAEDVALATCSGPGQAGCLDPCPVCGNGLVEYPETCDDPGTPESCDGCSTFCRIEACDDHTSCTTDSCAPALGCRYAPVANGTSCADADVCDGSEVCLGGACRPGTLPPNGTPCTGGTCQGGVCTGSATTTTTRPPTTTTTRPPTTTTTTTTTRPPTTSTTTTAPSTTITTTTRPSTTTTTTRPSTTSTTTQPLPTTTTAAPPTTTTTTTTPPATTSSTTQSPPTTTTVAPTTTSTVPPIPTTTTLPRDCDPAQPLACDDGDRCTMDSCSADGRCEYLQVSGSDAVRCRLENLAAMLGTMSSSGGAGVRLRARLGRAQRKLDAALGKGPGARGVRALRQARREIDTFKNQVLRERRRKTIGDHETAALLEAARDARTRMDLLLADLRVPLRG